MVLNCPRETDPTQYAYELIALLSSAYAQAVIPNLLDLRPNAKDVEAIFKETVAGYSDDVCHSVYIDNDPPSVYTSIYSPFYFTLLLMRSPAFIGIMPNPRYQRTLSMELE